MIMPIHVEFVVKCFNKPLFRFHVSCHVSSHIKAQLSQTSQHISALYAAATMLIKPVARHAWQAHAQTRGTASNSLEQLRLSWTAPKLSELLCCALSCSLMHSQTCAEVSHGNDSGDSWVLSRSPHWRAQPIANRCWTSSPANWLRSIAYCNIYQHIDRVLIHLETSCPKCLQVSGT